MAAQSLPAMSRLILRLLLCLALVFNGVAAPWAHAHMRHG
jgi:hypothetical protein